MANEVERRAGLGGRLVSLAGELTLAQTAAVLCGAKLFVGGDSDLH